MLAVGAIVVILGTVSVGIDGAWVVKLGVVDMIDVGAKVVDVMLGAVGVVSRVVADIVGETVSVVTSVVCSVVGASVGASVICSVVVGSGVVVITVAVVVV